MTTLSGISEGYRRRLESIGVVTVEDLLRYYPRTHEDFTKVVPIVFLREGEGQTVKGKLDRANLRFSRRKRNSRIVDAFFSDGTGVMKAVWFNQPFVMNRLKEGTEYTLSGKVRRGYGATAGLEMQNPAFEFGDQGGLHTARLVPVYRESRGLTSRWLRAKIADALPAVSALRDQLPAEVERRQGLPSLPEAVRQVHFPTSEKELQAAQRRIAFIQLLVTQLAVVLRRRERETQVAPVIPYDVEVARRIRDALPFKLTDAQRKAAHAIFNDLAETRPMARLLQGDVGSGKTAVAAMATAMAAAAGRQTLFMAPTEILAQQHLRTLEPYLEPLHIRTALLVGSTTQSVRRALLEELAEGDLDLLIGTHALLEPQVMPQALGLVITDEQHRFGVDQRQALTQKGVHPHLLSMTATPIPRTLQLTLFGDLDISVLDEMPPGRMPVETRLVHPSDRARAYDFVRAQVKAGRQAFVICPLVEESEVLQVRSATGEYKRLAEDVFPDLRLGLVHGRLKPAAKNAVMSDFEAGRLDILVSTAVVEVGVDVRNASVMLIEGAERFGLAQLHQFRGRVGRGSHPAFCLLFSDDQSQDSNRRLEAIVKHSSGFDLAELDLQIRGPGDVIGGSAQSGRAQGIIVAGLMDARLIVGAREEADRLIAEGLHRWPELEQAAVDFHVAGSLS